MLKSSEAGSVIAGADETMRAASAPPRRTERGLRLSLLENARLRVVAGVLVKGLERVLEEGAESAVEQVEAAAAAMYEINKNEERVGRTSELTLYSTDSRRAWLTCA